MSTLRGANLPSKREYYGIFTNYCGFGGSGVNRHKLDVICHNHDNDYKKIIAKDGYYAAYVTYNWADKKMEKAIQRITPKSERERIAKRASEWFLHGKTKYLEDTQSNLQSEKQVMPRQVTPDDDDYMVPYNKRDRTPSMAETRNTKRHIRFDDDGNSLLNDSENTMGVEKGMVSGGTGRYERRRLPH